MGKGDGRSRRGKIFKASYGNTRPKTKAAAIPTKPASSTAKKPPVAKKGK